MDKYFGARPDTTLEEAKKMLHQRVIVERQENVRCYCCGSKLKIYRRQIYAPMAAALICLYRYFHHGEYVHKNQLAEKNPKLAVSLGGGDFAKMRHWKLIEEKPKDDDKDTATSGEWRITPKGVQYVEGNLSVPKYALVLLGNAIGSEGESRSIHDALQKKFSYAELLGRSDQ